jgi:hypothetical protein
MRRWAAADIAAEQGAVGGRAQPLQQGAVGGVEGHHPGGLEQPAARGGFAEEPPTAGDDDRTGTFQQLGHGGQLDPPERVLPIQVDDLGRAPPGAALDLRVGVAELPAETVGEPPSEGGLARPGKADQGHRPRAGRGRSDHRSLRVLRR